LPDAYIAQMLMRTPAMERLEQDHREAGIDTTLRAAIARFIERSGNFAE